MLQHTRHIFAAAAAFAALALAGCTSAGGQTTTGNTPNTATMTPTTPAPAPTGPFGPACASLPASGPGSAAAMADQPVATAAAQSPALSTLVTVVTQAGLVDTLNNAQDITVFAPTNEAFAKIPQDTLNQVLADKQKLTGILTYHVVGQRLAPADLENGSLPTLQGGNLTAAKSGDTYIVNDAGVVCGNIQTSNATVYLIDSVLMPTS